MDQAQSVIEPGKKISMWNFHQITGCTGENLLRPIAKYTKIELTGKFAPCEICAQAKIRQANVPKKNGSYTGQQTELSLPLYIYNFLSIQNQCTNKYTIVFSFTRATDWYKMCTVNIFS